MNDTAQSRSSTPARQTARIILIVTAFLLPTLSLIPLGGFYLWEKGWMLWWAIGALGAVAIAMLLQRSLLNQATQVADEAATSASGAGLEYQTKKELLAWADVRAIATKVDVDKLDTADAIIELGQNTVNAVARRLHPEKPDAVWRFTLPQALAISERVSGRLGDFVDTRIPFGDRLTVAQLMSVYGWRRYVGVAEQAYDVWRVIRMANPATAVTQEARERLSRSLMNWGKEHVSRRIAEAFVEEVGRAAIDLYSGRLTTAGDRAVDQAKDTAAEGAANTAPPSIVVVGSDDATRTQLHSDLTTALAGRAASINSNGNDSPGLVNVSVTDAIYPRGFARRQLTRAISSADVVVWTASAQVGPSESDENAIAELRRFFVSSNTVVPPVVIIAATGAPTDAPRELARYVGDLASGFYSAAGPYEIPAATILAVASSGPARNADLTRLADTIQRSLLDVRAARSTAFDRTTARRGLWASAGQAATAVGGLAGALLKPRVGGSEKSPSDV